MRILEIVVTIGTSYHQYHHSFRNDYNNNSKNHNCCYHRCLCCTDPDKIVTIESSHTSTACWLDILRKQAELRAQYGKVCCNRSVLDEKVDIFLHVHIFVCMRWRFRLTLHLEQLIQLLGESGH